MGAMLDLVKVLFEPGAVFERVREKPKFLAPFVGLVVVQLIVTFLNLPFIKAMMQARAAQGPAGGPDPSKFAAVGLVFVPVGIAVALLLAALVLWVLVSVMGGEAKFSMLLSVAAYTAVPTVVLLSLVSAIVLQMKGVGGVTSPADMQPALGLDLLAPGTTGFMGAVLKAINPFSIWGLVLTAIGVSITCKLSKGTGYTVATIAFLLGVVIAGTIASLFGGRMG